MFPQAATAKVARQVWMSLIRDFMPAAHRIARVPEKFADEHAGIIQVYSSNRYFCILLLMSNSEYRLMSYNVLTEENGRRVISFAQTADDAAKLYVIRLAENPTSIRIVSCEGAELTIDRLLILAATEYGSTALALGFGRGAGFFALREPWRQITEL